MRRYQRRPKEIEAVQFHEGNAQEVAAWCGGTLEATATAPDELMMTIRSPAGPTEEVYLGMYVQKLAGKYVARGQAAFEHEFEPIPES